MITVTLNGVVIGNCGSDFVLGEESVDGLGMPDIKAQDLDFQGMHGAVGGKDYLAVRTIGVPILIYRKEDPQAAMEAARTLKTAWQPANSGNNTEVLTIGSSGFGPASGDTTFYGRPRGGIELDLEQHHAGLIRAYASFACLDPLGYGPEETDSGTTLTIDNVGDAASNRITIEVTGDGNTPVIQNTTDDNRAIRFGTPLAGAATRQIDVRSRTVLDGSTDKYAELSPVNQWFDLVPGENELLVTGASSIDITWRPAWF